MLIRNVKALFWSVALLAISPVAILGSVPAAFAQAPAPSAAQVTANISQALAILKASANYRTATPAAKALLLAQAVRNVVAAALRAGASAATIATGLNTAVANNVVSGAIAVQGAALAAVEVAAAGGTGSGQAAALTGDVQSQTNIAADIAANGSAVAVTQINASGATVTVLTSLSTILTAAADGNLSSSGAVTGAITTTTTSGYSPCVGVAADYC